MFQADLTNAALANTALLLSLKQISPKPDDRFIARMLAAKKQFLPVGMWSRSNRK
jgi:hypothetical protein